MGSTHVLLAVWQKPDVQVLANCQPNSVCSCREDAASYGIIWDKEGTAGINAERMGRTNAVSIHPTKLSFPSSAAGENMGELFSIQEKPTGKSLLIPKLFFISPAGDATSSTHRCPTASL